MSRNGLAAFEGPPLIVGVPATPSMRAPGLVKSVSGAPAMFLKASISDIQRWRAQGVSAIALEVDQSVFAAEKVFQRYCHLGFDVFLHRYSLLSGPSAVIDLFDGMECLFRCAWAFLPFLTPAPPAEFVLRSALAVPSKDSGRSRMQLEALGLLGLVSALKPLHELVREEERVVRLCWGKGIWHWSGVPGFSGVRSAMRIIETENVHLMRMGLSRAQRGFVSGIDVFTVGVQRLLERRPAQLRAVEKMLSRL